MTTDKQAKTREGLRIWSEGCGRCSECPYQDSAYCTQEVADDTLQLLEEQDRQLKDARRYNNTRINTLRELRERLEGVSDWAIDIVDEMIQEIQHND